MQQSENTRFSSLLTKNVHGLSGKNFRALGGLFHVIYVDFYLFFNYDNSTSIIIVKANGVRK